VSEHKSGAIKLSDLSKQMQDQNDIVDWQLNLQKACFGGITESDIQEIVKNQVEKAKAGDQNAIKFVMGHLLGGSRPINVHNTQIITDVERAARLARSRSAS
jgi:hypothetical protein